MAGHKRFTLAKHIEVYFGRPRRAWQRGSNENTKDDTCPRAATCTVTAERSSGRLAGDGELFGVVARFINSPPSNWLS